MKRVVVTGGSRGLGLAVCHRLLSEGYQVVTGARKVTAELTQLLEQFHGRLEYQPVDFSLPEAAQQFASSARLLEGVDGFVANAALGMDGLLTLTAEAALRECVEVNLVAPMLLAREAIKGMLNQGGSLIFISSVAARQGYAGLSVYSATKGALIAFSRSLAREYGERGIRSNCVLPGFLETDMNAALTPELKQKIRGRAALKRLGRVDEVVGCISFLLSDEAKYITGTELVVDGGLSA